MLIGGYSVLAKSPGGRLAGNSTAHASGVGQATSVRPGRASSDWRKWTFDGTARLSRRDAPTSQGIHRHVWLPNKAGAMSAVNRIAGYRDDLSGIPSPSHALRHGDVAGVDHRTGVPVAALSARRAYRRPSAPDGALTGAIAGTATISGDVVTTLLCGSAAIAGTATVSGTMVAGLGGEAALSGAATVSAAIVGVFRPSASLSGAATPLFRNPSGGRACRLLDLRGGEPLGHAARGRRAGVRDHAVHRAVAAEPRRQCGVRFSRRAIRPRRSCA